MNQQIDMNTLLQIIGTKEVELVILRNRINKLEQELDAKGKVLSKEPLSKDTIAKEPPPAEKE